MGYLLPRRPLFAADLRAREGMRRAFHAPQRERVARPVPAQPRKVTLEERADRREARKDKPSRDTQVKLDVERKRQWHRSARAWRKAVPQ